MPINTKKPWRVLPKSMMQIAFSLLLAGTALTTVATDAWAQPVSDTIDPEVIEKIHSYIANEIVLLSIRNQNEKYKDISDEEVIQLDSRWRAELDSDKKSLISATLSNPLSAYLTRVQAHSSGLFIEIFIMDNKGLNVGQSNISSDYWQGDEDKWQETFLKGPETIHLGETEWKSDTKIWGRQVNIAISDPANGSVIGAATFEVNLTELNRRQ